MTLLQSRQHLPKVWQLEEGKQRGRSDNEPEEICRRVERKGDAACGGLRLLGILTGRMSHWGPLGSMPPTPLKPLLLSIFQESHSQGKDSLLRAGGGGDPGEK